MQNKLKQSNDCFFFTSYICDIIIIGDNMSKFYDENFIEDIKGRINNGEFESKEALAQYLKNIPEMVASNEEMLRRLESSGIEHNVEDLNNVATIILDYYDKTKVNTSSLNLDNVTGFKVDDKDYIKVENPDDTYTVLDDNMSKDDFATQFQDKQNSSMDYKTSNGVQNREEIIDAMQKEKEEANLVSTVDIDKRDLTPQERREFASIMHMQETDINNFAADTKRNIYINRDTGETYYTHLNSLGQMEIRKADEKGVENVSKDVNAIDENGIEASVTVENPAEQIFEQMDDYELEYTLNNRLDSLTDEQKIALKSIIEKRKIRLNQQEIKNEQATLDVKPKVKVLTMKDLNKKYNGFTSIVFICLLTSIYGTFFILYLLISNGMLK